MRVAGPAPVPAFRRRLVVVVGSERSRGAGAGDRRDECHESSTWSREASTTTKSGRSLPYLPHVRLPEAPLRPLLLSPPSLNCRRRRAVQQARLPGPPLFQYLSLCAKACRRERVACIQPVVVLSSRFFEGFAILGRLTPVVDARSRVGLGAKSLS